MICDSESARLASKVFSSMASGEAIELGRPRTTSASGRFDNQPKEIRLAIVDRFPVVRQGIRRMLAAVPDIVVVAEADDGEEMIDVLLRRSADVLLIDPGLGLSATQYWLESINSRLPDLGIVVFSSSCRDSDIDFAIQAGVTGYLLKSTLTVGLVTTIRRAADKSTCFCEEATARLVSWDARRHATTPVSRLSTLTDREFNVIRLLSKGLSTKAIGTELCLSAKTVDNHRTRIMAKLNIHDRVELCRFAMREGIITP